MKALFVRMYKFVRLRALLCAVVITIIGVLVIPMGRQGSFSQTWLLVLTTASVGFLLAMIAMTIAGAARYQRSAGTTSHEQALLPLLLSTLQYCLVLRPFGYDGGIVVPDMEGRVVGTSWLFRKNKTLEQVVATAARRALDLETIGIVDQNKSIAPPDITYVRVPNDMWKEVVRDLIKRAHSLVLIVPPGAYSGDGFVWEVGEIAALQRRSRVLMLMPPRDQDIDAHRAALNRAAEILAQLDSTDVGTDANTFVAYEHQLALDPATHVVKCLEKGGFRWWAIKLQDRVPRARKGEADVDRFC